MLDFAKSIMTGNASGIKEFNTEADLRRWCIEHQYAYTPTHGGYYRLEDDKPGRNRPDLEAHVKAGNKKVGNSSKSEIIEKKKKEGATLKVDNGQKLEFSDGSTFVKTSFSDDYREAHNYVGNSKVGNGLSDSYEFLMSAGKNDYNSIKEEVKKAGGWTPEIKAKARKTSDVLKKKAKELVETAHKQAAELERLAGNIESI